MMILAGIGCIWLFLFIMAVIDVIIQDFWLELLEFCFFFLAAIFIMWSVITVCKGVVS